MIEKAIQLAKTSTSRYKLATILTDKRGRLISSAVNDMEKSHTVQARYAKKVGMPEKIMLHSELRACLRASRKPHTAFVVRVKASGQLGDSKPCKICSAALKEKGIKVIYYSTNEGTIVREEI